MRRLWFAVCLLGACGDNAPPCDYVEQNDPGNSATAEATGLAIGPDTHGVCGQIDPGHRDPAVSELDEDRFAVTIGGSGEVLVELVGGEGAQLLDSLVVRLYAAVNNALVGQGQLAPSLADHVAFVADVTPGAYVVAVSATSAGELLGQIGYHVRLSPDPSLGCPAVTHLPDYVEAGDGSGETGNDVVSVSYAATTPFSALGAAGGSAEPTGLAIASGDAVRLTGIAGTRAGNDDYLDRDTYAFATDDSTNELTVRLDWRSAVDLDYYVFEQSSLVPAGIATRSGVGVHELQTFAVKPSTAYWLWVGRYAADNQSTQPAIYDATVCGQHFYY